jgi:hypothetical protein
MSSHICLMSGPWFWQHFWPCYFQHYLWQN